MPVKVNEFIIQAKFNDDGAEGASSSEIENVDIKALKDEIIKECMEKVEILLDRRENR